MKLFILLLATVLTIVTSQAQTNVYYAKVIPNAKTKKTGCGAGYFFSGIAVFKPSSLISSNTYYYPTTNILRISFTNNDALLQAESAFGQAYCGHGSVTFTDIFYPNDIWRFVNYWSNNVALPGTNNPIPLTTVGFRTNSP